jgi:hypothetical protein
MGSGPPYPRRGIKPLGGASVGSRSSAWVGPGRAGNRACAWSTCTPGEDKGQGFCIESSQGLADLPRSVSTVPEDPSACRLQGFSLFGAVTLRPTVALRCMHVHASGQLTVGI